MSTEWIQLYLVPTIGTILVLFIFGSNYPAVQNIHKTQKLGQFDLVPYAWLIVNNVTWLAYIPDLALPGSVFVFICHWVGLVAALLIFRFTWHLASKETTRKISTILIGLVGIFVPFAFIVRIAADSDTRIRILSTTAILGQLSFFAAPLLQLKSVIKAKSAETLNFPLAVTCALATALWTAFGFAIQEFAIVIPNIISFALSAIQLVMIWIYRAPKTKELLSKSAEVSVQETELQKNSEFPAITPVPQIESNEEAGVPRPSGV
jgi:solute carrier family 50 protein (sugar transporter)